MPGDTPSVDKGGKEKPSSSRSRSKKVTYSTTLLEGSQHLPDLSLVPEKSVIKKRSKNNEFHFLEYDDVEIQRDYPDGSDLPETGVIIEHGEVGADFRRIVLNDPKYDCNKARRSLVTARAYLERLNKADFEGEESISYRRTHKFAVMKKQRTIEAPPTLIGGVIVEEQPRQQKMKRAYLNNSKNRDKASSKGKRMRMDDNDGTQSSFEEKSDANDSDYKASFYD